ncbi:hypothetical protein [Dethiosulfovibrio salsuginis]|uniref:Uncharacterized protein n=1 Tax=Dethiosulfovibrio salsuginis TaxID=561720 RepID=A0A1X7IWR7_9BACT|nr:hypothetical protein [Dethiosulfovibrio salsuginis]SMG19531.1 hypothetical protein SAMN06275492_10616 [Dethiosulfovibrio salsuginis]
MSLKKLILLGALSAVLFVSRSWALSFSMDEGIAKDLSSRGGPFYLSWGTYKDF